MITNIPKAEDFKNVGKQCLIQSFNIVFEEDRYLIEDSNLPRKEFWKYHLALLNTSVILVYQAIEALLKSQICKESALLLIDLKRQDWPTGPGSQEKDFNDLFTISGESLTKTYSATIGNENININLVEFIEEVRKTRNRIVHGASHNHITPEYIITIILKTFENFLGVDSWWKTTRGLLIDNPIFGIYNEDYEEADFLERLDYVEQIMGKGAFNNHFKLDLGCRRYLCPWCWEALGQESKDLHSKWAFLAPQNTENAKDVVCVNCKRDHKVSREDCIQKDCKGNVIHHFKDGKQLCLTCGWWE